MKFTYLGHSCFSIKFGGYSLLFDPFISPNKLARDIDIDSIEADYILLSHGHEDHVVDLQSIAKRTGAILISNFELATYFGEKGIETHPMNHGGVWEFPFGKVKYVSAIHSSVLPDGTYGGNPGGFVISGKDETFYFAGDTALTYDMKLIPEMGFELDLAILPVGDNFTMGPKEALKASEFIKCNTIIGVHFDTFPYIEIDHSSEKKMVSEKGKTLHLPEVGENIEI